MSLQQYCYRYSTIWVLGTEGYEGKTVRNKAPQEDCFTATPVYRDYEHDNVITNHAFRYSVIPNSYIDRKFVRLYFKYEPGKVRLSQ